MISTVALQALFATIMLRRYYSFSLRVVPRRVWPGKWMEAGMKSGCLNIAGKPFIRGLCSIADLRDVDNVNGNTPGFAGGMSLMPEIYSL